ncbi:MAG: archaellin/type IV pilin N-terminal domain-containing protein [Candidatus Hecatellaceae archaeon]
MGGKAVSPVLATLLMIAVAVSMSVILFVWSQGFLATTSEAASQQQQAQNIVTQSQIAIEAVQFADAMADDGATVVGDNQAVKIMVRNVGTSKVTIAQVYMGTNAYQMTAYPAYQAMREDSEDRCPIAPEGYATIGGQKYTQNSTTYYGTWYVSEAAVEIDDLDKPVEGKGYQGTIGTIYAQYRKLDDTNDQTQTQNTAIVYVFSGDGTADADGVIDPQGFAVIHLYLGSAWSAGETYFIKVTTTVGTFAETVVTAPA